MPMKMIAVIVLSIALAGAINYGGFLYQKYAVGRSWGPWPGYCHMGVHEKGYV